MKNTSHIFNISSSYVKSKLHTKNQLEAGDSYEEDLKFGIWKNLNIITIIFAIFILIRLIYRNRPSSLISYGDRYEEDHNNGLQKKT